MGVILYKRRVAHLLEKEGAIPHLNRQMRKVLGSIGVNMKEFFDDISRIKRKSSYALP